MIYTSASCENTKHSLSIDFHIVMLPCVADDSFGDNWYVCTCHNLQERSRRIEIDADGYTDQLTKVEILSVLIGNCGF